MAMENLNVVMEMPTATEEENAVMETPVVAQPLTALYVGDIDEGVMEEELRRVFGEIGEVASVKICMDQDLDRSLGYGYVNYTNPDHAAKAIEQLNSTPLKGKCIRISYSIPDATLRKKGAGNLFVKNLDKEINHKALRKIFSPLGNIISAKVEMDPSGTSRGYGYVHYDTEVAASNAIEQLNGVAIKGKNIYVARFISKEERGKSTNFSNLFVKNFSEWTTEDDLMTMFEPFGSITSVAIMRDANGDSKCFGFVSFSRDQEASKAILEMNRKIMGGKPLYVAVAERKESRQARLKAMFANARPVAIPPLMSVYDARPVVNPPHRSGPGQHMYRIPAPIFPPTPYGFGYHSQPGNTPRGPYPIPPPPMSGLIYQPQLGQPNYPRYSGATIQRMARPLIPPGYAYRNA